MTAFLLITIGHVTFSCHASNVGLGAPITGGEVGAYMSVRTSVLDAPNTATDGQNPGSNTSQRLVTYAPGQH